VRSRRGGKELKEQKENKKEECVALVAVHRDAQKSAPAVHYDAFSGGCWRWLCGWGGVVPVTSFDFTSPYLCIAAGCWRSFSEAINYLLARRVSAICTRSPEANAVQWDAQLNVTLHRSFVRSLLAQTPPRRYLQFVMDLLRLRFSLDYLH